VSELYEKLSKERKDGQTTGAIPDWYTTGGWQMVKGKYLMSGETVKGMYKRVAMAAAKHMPRPSEWEGRFFNVMWSGWLSPATPILVNMGNNRGMPVSCSGAEIQDHVRDFYQTQAETAELTKNGFGTSADLSRIRPRGAPISTGGHASGILPVLKDYVQLSRDVSQGNNRRGAWAGYLDIEHGDFWEVADYLMNNPDDLNLGWNIRDTFIDRLNAGDEEMHNRWRRVLKIRAVTGKGYLCKLDTINRQSPQMYRDLQLKVKASNLCTEITLFSDADHSFTCVLSSMNLSKWEDWKNTDAVFVATVFLDCVAQEFIDLGRKIPGLERAVRFTEKGRALGLGVLGFHSLLQKKATPFGDFRAHTLNNSVFKHLHDESLKASQWMAKELGEPEWCKGYGVRNTHRTAVAPTMSTSIICGGNSQGIEPIVANAYNQNSSVGEIKRVNPQLVTLMKERGVYDDPTIKRLVDNLGSVQEEEWLTDEEKQVFLTAYEINQQDTLRLASARQKHLCQAQSLNLFFSANEDEEYIAFIHQQALLDPMINSLYYLRSMSNVRASKGECTACHA
jgi:ribonucleoside-diphosphate reductase alpha chain